MNKISIIAIATLSIISTICISSCQKIADEELDNDDIKSGNELRFLNIKTRSQSSTTIEYPLMVYVFTEKGDLRSAMEIKAENDSIRFSLGKGTYKIVSISGFGQEYLIAEKPSLNELIKFKNEPYKHAKKSMMMGTSTVSVDKKDINVVLTLSYCVSSVEVSLYNIPLNTKSVKFSLSPLYDAISYNGDYKKVNNDDEFYIDCHLGIDGIWKAGPVYIFPSCSSTTTFNITIEKESSITTYSYLYNGTLQASQPFVLKGNYAGEITVSGSILITGWNDTLLVDFDFSSSSDQPNSEEDGQNNNPPQGTPTTGDIWNGCIVAKAESVQSGTNLLLLSLDEWDVIYTEGEGIVSSYSINGITGWSLPTWEEASYLRKTFNGTTLDELNEKIDAAGGDLIFDDADTRFLCYNKDNIISSFRFTSSSNIIRVTNESKTYYIRAVKNYLYQGS